ncbi:VOC family protein [Halocynthiibacter sp.]|uniref:VOC family protein n=1 Tax=Halocynthiibacter sp. TaxID=1979210 RepID=UPI003C47BA5E
MSDANFKPQNAMVWAEIPVSNLEKAVIFYNAVFHYDLQTMDMGPNMIALIPTADGQGVAANLYEGKPAKDGSGATLHLLAPDTLEATAERFKSAGGEVLAGDPVVIPAGRFVYGIDPDGNSIGLFEGN